MNATKNGLTRADIVRINRMQREYTQDELPHREQIIFDNGWLIGLVMRLDEEINKLRRNR